MNNEKMNKIPAIRFPGFNGEWEESNVGNIIETITPVKKLQSCHYCDSGKYPIIDQSPKAYCGFSDDDSAVNVIDGPVVIFGDHTCVVKYCDKPFIQGADGIKIMNSKKNVHSSFLYQAILANPVNQDGYKRHFSELKEKKIALPSLPEQQKIADCLSSLDASIKAEEDQLQALKDHKRGLMQKLFPKEGETAPEFRFPGFSGEWVVKELGIIGKFRKGQPFAKDEINNNGLNPCIHYGELFTKYKEVITTVISKTDSLVGVSSKNGDILFPASDVTPEGLARCSTILQPNVLLGGDMVVFTPEEVNNPVFLSYSLNNEKEQLKKIAVGAVIKHLKAKDLANVKVALPSLPEQQKIAGCLSSIDTEIAAQQEKVDALKEHKKGLMQKLFPRFSNKA